MLTRLPGWVVDDATSVREEVADLVGASPEQLWRMAKRCARDARWAVRATVDGHADPGRVLDHRDPLPPTTLAAMARLRKQAGWGDAGR